MSSAPSSVPDHRRFNHTIRYQQQLLADLPEHARTAIDAGCGEGLAARTLARAGLTVTGIDADEPSIERARAQESEGITYVVGDIFATDLEAADVVYSGALLHHMDIDAGLERLKSWVAPGGRLCVVGAARATWRDLYREMGASIADKAFALVKGSWQHGSPTVWPPPHTYREVQQAAMRVLPGAEYKSRLLWRYTIVWDRPSDA
ncbi:class I SAM-dependent methyltransferase [Demequina sp.]|uniref:class I SAM-dependent methyltransferase n=1 Tax=Demequina sp. TaxID=2050685 RepID=UPI0025B9B35C|nr:class I SAM-dependent methyltransferase [Demequina sp.]